MIKPTHIAKLFYRFFAKPRTNYVFWELLASMSRSRPLHVLQVGANDGVMYDPIDKILRKHANVSATRIEPISEYFNELKENCRRYASQVELFNICITDADGPIEMYFPDPNRSGQGGDKGHGSLRPEAVGRSREGWSSRAVVGKSFQTLMKEMQTPRADVYVSDCEGYDIQLLQQLPIEELGIRVIYIELLHQTMSWGQVAEGLQQVVAIVASHGFNRILWDGSDFLSWRAPSHSTSQDLEVEGFTRS